MPVNTPCQAYAASIDQWRRCRDCYDGEDAVKARGTEYLPALDSQSMDGDSVAYEAYKKRALFYGAYGRTVEGLAGLIHRKAVTVELTPAIDGHEEDVTLSSISLDQFALDTTKEVIKVGRLGVWIDMPPAAIGLDGQPAPPASAAEAPRPYWLSYRAEDILSWRTTRINGVETLVLVVLRECVYEADPKDPWVEVEVDQCRVLRLDGGVYTVEVWREVETGGKREWQLISTAKPTRRGKPLGFIPFVVIGPTDVDPGVEKPPLLALADVNLSHYRTSADLEHGRHFTALPTPWFTGPGRGDGAAPLRIGSAEAWDLGESGSAGMLEFTGQGLGALEKAEETKRKHMATLGARLLEDAPSTAETMGAVSMRHAGEHATVATIAQSVEQGLTIVLRWHGWWMGTEDRPEDVEAGVEFSKEFFAVRATPGEVHESMLQWQAEAISFETHYQNLQRGGWARDGVSTDDELDQIRKEGGGTGLGGPPKPPAPPPVPGQQNPPMDPGDDTDEGEDE